jgi:hypothetical protein
MTEWEQIEDYLTEENFKEAMEKLFRQAFSLYELAVRVGFSHAMAEHFAWDWYERTIARLTAPPHPLVTIFEQLHQQVEEGDDEGQS